jgi:hypothetical protein
MIDSLEISDADRTLIVQNCLQSALSFVQVLAPGVYIAMNGKCFPWECGDLEEIPLT